MSLRGSGSCRDSTMCCPYKTGIASPSARNDASCARVGYQFKAGPLSSHRRIAALLKKNPSGARILELGTAAGFIGRELLGRGYEITGVEIDASLAEQARPYYHKILLLDLERQELPQEAPFEALVAADVLEHLRQPESVLSGARRLLKEEALAVISLPNVANIFVRIGLLFGSFYYAERGILDKTHLRFFTLKSARKLIRGCGFRITAVYPAPLPFELVIKSRLLSACLAGLYYPLARIFPGLFAYQFIFVAKMQSGSHCEPVKGWIASVVPSGLPRNDY